MFLTYRICLIFSNFYSIVNYFQFPRIEMYDEYNLKRSFLSNSIFYGNFCNELFAFLQNEL